MGRPRLPDKYRKTSRIVLDCTESFKAQTEYIATTILQRPLTQYLTELIQQANDGIQIKRDEYSDAENESKMPDWKRPAFRVIVKPLPQLESED